MKNQSSFPKPERIGTGCTRWRLSELLAYEAARDGKAPPAVPPERERYLSARQVAARYDASVTSVWRWAREGVAA